MKRFLADEVRDSASAKSPFWMARSAYCGAERRKHLSRWMCGWQRAGRSRALLPCRVCGEEEEVEIGSWCAGLWGFIEAMVLLAMEMVMSHVLSASWHGSLTLRIWVIFRPRVRRVSGVSLGLSDGGWLVVLFWGGGMVGGGEWVFDMFLGDLDHLGGGGVV